MSTGKKKLILNSVAVDLGCGSCRRPKLLLSHIFHPKKIRRHSDYRKRTRKPDKHYYSSSGSLETTNTSTFSDETPAYYSSDTESDIKSLRAVQGFGKLGGESVAVEKDSDDPYLDFRQSMLQMILENEIYSKDDLKELLNCFLQLNSPYYHGVIVRAFTEIWNGVFSVRSTTASPYLHGGGRWGESRDF
ncbi:OLC1v1034110C1 [Oldenlandia corymbosa var. corymbosa]|uniref:Transcription repressor n=1 Tax=Oldenlandia corymbosa var. corymbosa TaxID=529605 RepID=A0AAV1CSM3_OLDCO|nr:OLC1v1034110C1 [Oldenlandia corymbosa var. corymbosa]